MGYDLHSLGLSKEQIEEIESVGKKYLSADDRPNGMVSLTFTHVNKTYSNGNINLNKDIKDRTQISGYPKLCNRVSGGKKWNITVPKKTSVFIDGEYLSKPEAMEIIKGSRQAFDLICQDYQSFVIDKTIHVEVKAMISGKAILYDLYQNDKLIAEEITAYEVAERTGRKPHSIYQMERNKHMDRHGFRVDRHK